MQSAERDGVGARPLAAARLEVPPPACGGEAAIRSSRRRGSGAEEVEDVETVPDEVDQRLRGNQRLATKNGIWRQGRDARRQGGPLGEQRRIELIQRVV